MRSKKSSFLNFCFAFLPGCAEMYMGFMKMGLSLMVAFYGIVAASIFLNLSPLLFVCIVIWFYSFFHARNLATMDNTMFQQLDDRYLYTFDSLANTSLQFDKKLKKIIAVILIVLGVVMVFRGIYSAFEYLMPDIISTFYNSISYYLPQIVVGLGIIFIGKLLIDGKKEELYVSSRIIEKGDQDNGTDQSENVQ